MHKRSKISMNHDDICWYVMPGLGCGMPEFVALGVLNFVTAFASLYLLYAQYRNQSREEGFKPHYLFWFFTFLWTGFNAVVNTFDFSYTTKSAYVIEYVISSLLFFLYFGFFMAVLMYHYFDYRPPKNSMKSLYYIIFVASRCFFIFLCVAFSFLSEDAIPVGGDCIMLWNSMCDIIFLCYTTAICYKLIAAITYPIIQPQDVRCIANARISIIIFIVLFIFRFLYHFGIFVSFNPIHDFLRDERREKSSRPSGGYRALQCVIRFVMDWAVCAGTMLATYFLRRHDMDFNDDSFYAPAKDTSD